MTTLTEADRTILAATRFYCDCTDAYCSMRNELDTAVEQILAAREAALLDRLTGTRAAEVAYLAYFDAAKDDSEPGAMVTALAAVRAELLRQGGGEE